MRFSSLDLDEPTSQRVLCLSEWPQRYDRARKLNCQVRPKKKSAKKQPSLLVSDLLFFQWGFCFEHLEQSRGKAARHVVKRQSFTFLELAKNPDSCGILWTNKWWSDFYLELMFVCCLRFSPGRTRYFFKCLDTNQDNENTSQCNETATQAQLVGKTIRMRLPYKTLMIVGNCRLFHQILDMMYYIYIYSYRYHIVVPVLWQEFSHRVFLQDARSRSSLQAGWNLAFLKPWVFHVLSIVCHGRDVRLRTQDLGRPLGVSGDPREVQPRSHEFIEAWGWPWPWVARVDSTMTSWEFGSTSQESKIPPRIVTPWGFSAKNCKKWGDALAGLDLRCLVGCDDSRLGFDWTNTEGRRETERRWKIMKDHESRVIWIICTVRM